MPYFLQNQYIYFQAYITKMIGRSNLLIGDLLMLKQLEHFRSFVDARKQQRDHQLKFGSVIAFDDYQLLMDAFPDSTFSVDWVFIPKDSSHRYMFRQNPGKTRTYKFTFRVFDHEQEAYVTSTCEVITFSDLLEKLKNYETGNYRFVYRPSMVLVPMGDPRNY